MEAAIPIPFLFNPYKHHLNTILDFIEVQRQHIVNEEVKSVLNKIGNSQMDIYTGRCSLMQIGTELKEVLKTSKLLEKESFLFHVKLKGYFETQIGDKSVWLFREGYEHKRYIHIHPGRYSLHTMRVKALTLKTYIAGALLSNQLTLETINKGRRIYLDLPPIKHIDNKKGIGGFIQVVNSIQGTQ